MLEMRTTDNTVKPLDDTVPFGETVSDETIKDLQYIANIKLKDIKLDEYPNLLVFPREWNSHKDDLGNSEIFSLSNDKKITTSNIMGFIGYKNTNLTIASRFAAKDNKDYFLYYMFCKLMKYNVFNLNPSGGKSDMLDLLPFFFPIFLKRALSQGLYREYKRNEYNNANMRGVVDIKRHLRLNVPFAGKMAYSTREYSCDNPVMQLIRHTIEYIKTKEYNSILTADSDTFSDVNQIMFASHGYDKNSRQRVIDANQKKPVVHPYFTEYKPLQRLCIRIMTEEKISANNENEKIHGILFDGAWLWEEYLNTILSEIGFEHPQNKAGKGGAYLFREKETKKLLGEIFPDFVMKTPSAIADAKYKYLEDRVNNHDYFQLIAYMSRFDAKKGYLVFPYSKEEQFKSKTLLLLKGFDKQHGDSEISLVGMAIPNHERIGNFRGFMAKMKNSEDELKGMFAYHLR